LIRDFTVRCIIIRRRCRRYNAGARWLIDPTLAPSAHLPARSPGARGIARPLCLDDHIAKFHSRCAMRLFLAETLSAKLVRAFSKME